MSKSGAGNPWLPPIWLPLAFLAIGFGGRASDLAEKAEVRVAAERATAVAATAAKRLADSTALADRIEDSTDRTHAELLALDAEVHGSSFALPHSGLHTAATRARLDSAASVLRLATTSAALLLTARQLLATGVDTALTAEHRRHAQLLSRAERLATSQADRARQEKAAQERRVARLSAQRRPAAPRGATARCRDGTYSYSATRRGTCSRHGGVASWL
jgi:hypothetical protein